MSSANIAFHPSPNIVNEPTATKHADAHPSSNNDLSLHVTSYKPTGTGASNGHEHPQSTAGIDDGHLTDRTAQDQQESETGSDVESEEADEPVRSRSRRCVPDEEEEEESEDGEYSDDGSGDSEDEEADEVNEKDIAEFQDKLKHNVAQRVPNQKVKWNQRHELFEDDEDVQEVPRQEFNRTLTAQPRIKQEPSFHSYSGPSQAQQQPQYVGDLRSMDPFAGGMYPGHQSQSFMSAPQPGMQPNHSVTSNGYQLQAHMPAAPKTPLPFSPGFPFNGFTGPHGQHGMGFRDAHYQPYGQALAQSGYNPLPMSPFETHGQSFVPPPQVHYQQAPRGVATNRNVQQRGVEKKHSPEEALNSSDDDEPLRERMQRHPSKVSTAVEDSSPPALKTTKRGKEQKQESDSEGGDISSKVKAKPKLGFKAPKATKAATVSKKSTAPAQSAPSTQPTQAAQFDQVDQASQPTIDWKLPRYEAIFEPPKTKDDPTVAKISIPRLVREELLLSPDHAQQEAHLLLHVFLPAHQALAEPDPAPATAALNFHTIALMVIEAFVQFEIGDEFGTGRGHWHNAHDQSDVEYLRQRSAKDADPDEIYFAVVDRWRAGMESGKESAKMIRGVQEFCDIALDVIFYIKENGLLKERKNAWEEKGSKKGAKKVEEDSEEEGFGAVAKGKKRGATKVNQVTPRKKPKTTTKPEPKKKKLKASGVAVTVVRKKR